MTRKLAALFVPICFALTFWAATAGANEIPDGTVNVTCDEVSFGWSHFPDTPVILHITVTHGEQFTAASYSTEGKYNGAGSVPVALSESGMAYVTFTWTAGEVDHEVNAQREIDCTTVTTTPPTTSPPTTAPPTVPPTVETPTSVVSALGPPVSLDPSIAELANTGPSHVWLDVLGGLLFVGFGAVCIAGSRTQRGRS